MKKPADSSGHQIFLKPLDKLTITGLAPDSNLDKAKADAIVDAVMDIRAKKRDVHFERDPSLKVSS